METQNAQQWSLSSLYSHPLFATLVSFVLIVVLYLPRPLLPLLFSPVLLSSSLLLFALLRLGPEPPEPPEPASAAPSKPASETHVGAAETRKNPTFRCEFAEWGRRGAPLEVIYEEYEEGAENGEEGAADSESESESTRGSAAEEEEVEGRWWDSGEKPCLEWWEEEEEGESDELIEIAIDEENLIEIDISAGR